ncbi:MAG: pyridoxamine 5'-phosphate oxidase family protein, partial [Opitutales bacterium]|nr:pyridoxamine 5'-phosphate oxidase family protein [Opitutales bacterium]
MAKDLSKLRKEYTGTSLSRNDLATNPLDQFERWFSQAQELEVVEPNAMSLSTVDENGQPWQRMVLLKAFDKRGFVFFTNFSSRKAKHIETNAQVSLLVPWVAIHR